jgi:TolA-binding protein
MSDAPDDLALQAVTETLSRSGQAPAACAALMRLAGQALARLTSHDRACRVHAELARRHAERAARCWRP